MLNHKQNQLGLGVVLLGVFWTKAATLISMPFLTLFLFKNTKLSITNIGLIVGMQPLALCFGSIVGGYFSDIFKRHKIMLFSVLISSLVYLCFYFTSKYLVHDLQIIAFALLNLLNGFCAALFAPVSNAIMSDFARTSQENIKFLHMRYMAINLGATLGPLIGAYAGIAASSQAFLLTMLLYFAYAAILFAALINYTQPRKALENQTKAEFKTSLKAIITNHRFIIIVVSLIIFNMLYVQLSSNLALVINKNIKNGVLFFSWMLSLSSIMVVIFQPIIYLIIKNYNQRLVLAYGYLIILICSTILAISPITKGSIVSFVTCLTIVEIIVFPTSYVLVTEFADKNYLGIAYGAIDFTYLGSAIGPLIGGAVIEHFTSNSFFSLIALLAFLSFVTYLPFIIKKD